MAGFVSINGRYFAKQNVDFRLNGLQFVGFKTLNYKDTVSAAFVKGAQQAPLGLTDGSYEASGDCELFLPQASTLISLLTPLGIPFGGWRNIPLTISVSYGPILGAIPPFVTDIITGARLVEVDAGVSEGDEGLTRKFGLKIGGQVMWNGVPSILDLGSIGAIG